jgi:hypothetical protein
MLTAFAALSAMLITFSSCKNCNKGKNEPVNRGCDTNNTTSNTNTPNCAWQVDTTRLEVAKDVV